MQFFIPTAGFQLQPSLKSLIFSPSFRKNISHRHREFSFEWETRASMKTSKEQKPRGVCGCRECTRLTRVQLSVIVTISRFRLFTIISVATKIESKTNFKSFMFHARSDDDSLWKTLSINYQREIVNLHPQQSVLVSTFSF